MGTSPARVLELLKSHHIAIKPEQESKIKLLDENKLSNLRKALDGLLKDSNEPEDWLDKNLRLIQ